MIIRFDDLEDRYGRPVKGIIHIGANSGQEIAHYVDDVKVNQMILFEPLPDVFAELRETVSKFEGHCSFVMHNVALGPQEGEAKMHVSDNGGQSSSLLKPTLHKKAHKAVKFTDEITVPVKRLDDVLDRDLTFNAIAIDVQGFELEVLKGAPETLKRIDYITSEVSRHQLYEGSALVNEMDDLLRKAGFQRIVTHWLTRSWGDALYVRTSLLPDEVETTEIEHKKPLPLYKKVINFLRNRP